MWQNTGTERGESVVSWLCWTSSLLAGILVVQCHWADLSFPFSHPLSLLAYGYWQEAWTSCQCSEPIFQIMSERWNKIFLGRVINNPPPCTKSQEHHRWSPQMLPSDTVSLFSAAGSQALRCLLGNQDTFSSSVCLHRKQMPIHCVINPVNRDIDAC